MYIQTICVSLAYYKNPQNDIQLKWRAELKMIIITVIIILNYSK